MTPGLHDAIPEADYHADQGSLSQSGAKLLLDSPAAYQWELEHPRPPSEAMVLGSALHTEVLGVGPEVVVIPPTGRKKIEQEAHAAALAAAEAAGHIALSPEQYERMTGMAKALRDHPTAPGLLDGRAEVSAWCPDDETGVMRRARVDVLRDDLAVDLKSALSASPGGFSRACASFGYYIQHPWYVDLLRDLGHEVRGFVFVVVESHPPHNVGVYELRPTAVERGREKARRALHIYKHCAEVNEWPGYSTDITPIDLPRWAYYDHEESA